MTKIVIKNIGQELNMKAVYREIISYAKTITVDCPGLKKQVSNEGFAGFIRGMGLYNMDVESAKDYAESQMRLYVMAEA